MASARPSGHDEVYGRAGGFGYLWPSPRGESPARADTRIIAVTPTINMIALMLHLRVVPTLAGPRARAAARGGPRIHVRPARILDHCIGSTGFAGPIRRETAPGASAIRTDRFDPAPGRL